MDAVIPSGSLTQFGFELSSPDSAQTEHTSHSAPLIAPMYVLPFQINELSQVPPPVMLLPDDFKASSKIKVNNHLFHRENLPSHFKFKEYCPQVFRNLRDRFGIDDQDYLVSLTRSPPSESEGSDGRFLISYDRTLVIKEVSSEDIADMHSNLSNYHQVRPLSPVLSLPSPFRHSWAVRAPGETC
uniref:Phosphatidylinositol 5-phosphate 4-kinase type-2 gamma n=1 Tax=Oryctolagus cuniculus TaxID=9986 RepID=A0A5F9D8J6_RABIT